MTTTTSNYTILDIPSERLYSNEEKYNGNNNHNIKFFTPLPMFSKENNKDGKIKKNSSDDQPEYMQRKPINNDNDGIIDIDVRENIKETIRENINNRQQDEEIIDINITELSKRQKKECKKFNHFPHFSSMDNLITQTMLLSQLTTPFINAHPVKIKIRKY